MELRAIGRVVAEGRGVSDPPCLVGSVKSNIGHTESASGVAGLIKAILCLRHREVPASLHFHRPNPQVPWSSLPLKVVTERTPLRPIGDRALISVNSFGITGTFANIIVEEMPADQSRGSDGEPVAPTGTYVLPVSARSEEALGELAGAYAERIEAGGESLADLCTSAALRRAHHEWRLAVVGSDRADIARDCAHLPPASRRSGLTAGSRRSTGRQSSPWSFRGKDRSGPEWGAT
jgi:acyl transferase domain-containing protein